MKVRLTLLAATVAAAGFAAAALRTVPALAWDWQSLPSGYSVRVETSVPGCAGSDVTVNGSHIGCTADSGFQSALDSYINSTICTVNPSAGGSQCAPPPPPPPTTTTSQQATTTTAGTTSAPTSTTTAAETTTAPSTSTTSSPTLSPPAAAFTSVITGLSVAFTDTSTAATPATVKTVSWQFGDGATAVGASPTHVYTLPGTFTVVEIVTDTSGLTDQAAVRVVLSAFAGPKRFAERLSPTLTRAVAVLGPARVFCVSNWGPAKPETGGGLAIVGSRQANISQALCAALIRRRGPLARALLTVGHETAHALGVRPERAADCYALKRIQKLAKQIGVGAPRERTRLRAEAAVIVKTRWRAPCWPARHSG